MSETKLVAAALSFCAFESERLRLKRSLRRCTEQSKGEPEIGVNGVAACRREEGLSEVNYCDNCKYRENVRPDIAKAKRFRDLAKDRMLRIYLKGKRADQGGQQ